MRVAYKTPAFANHCFVQGDRILSHCNTRKNPMTIAFQMRGLVLSLLFFISSGASYQGDGQAEARLLMACMSRSGVDSVEDVAEALSHGADIDIVDKRSGQTPLMAAALRGKEKIVKYLLDKGADTSIVEKDGYTLPHAAAYQGQVEILKLLKERGLDIISEEHKDGFLPFHRACWGKTPGHAAVVEYLLKEGVDPNLEAKDGQRCIEMTKNQKTKSILLSFGAQPSTDEEEEL